MPAGTAGGGRRFVATSSNSQLGVIALTLRPQPPFAAPQPSASNQAKAAANRHYPWHTTRGRVNKSKSPI